MPPKQIWADAESSLNCICGRSGRASLNGGLARHALSVVVTRALAETFEI